MTEVIGKDFYQRVLYFLVSTEEAYKKETIARQVGASVNTISVYLTEMRKVDLVQESNSFWSATPEGKELYTSNPNFSFKQFSNGNGAGRENWVEALLDEISPNIKGNYTCKYLESNKESLKHLLPSLSVFVAAWIVGKGYDLNIDFEDELEIAAQDEIVIDTINKLTKIVNL